VLAVLFPGQGSQAQNMREQVERFLPGLLELARSEVGDDFLERADEGTRWAQPAIFCAALAGWEQLRGDSRPAFMAGHSLGELTALVAAEAISPPDGLRLVTERGRLMQRAAERAGDGGMLAVLGDGGPAVAATAARHGLTLANDNAPGQLVLSGDRDLLRAAAADLEELRLKTRMLAVSGAFHSSAMASAEAALRDVLAAVEVREPRVPVFSCVTAEPFDDVRGRLAQSLTRPVRWREVVEALHARGVRRFVETGPGRILTGLVRRTLDGVVAEALRSPEAARA
jgi:[acyl-carrier-protein] S-malonyltransferase